MPFPKFGLNQISSRVATDTEIELMQDSMLGTTKFIPIEGDETAYVANEWVSLKTLTAVNTTRLKSLTIVNKNVIGLVGYAYRITCPPTTCIFSNWKNDTDNSFVSGAEMVFDEDIRIRQSADYAIEIYCAETINATATLVLLKIVEIIL